jgi:hypothetical protein
MRNQTGIVAGRTLQPGPALVDRPFERAFEELAQPGQLT